MHCLEPISSPRNADFFRNDGWMVTERDYGTRVYNEMFVLHGTDGLKLIEVRRSPKSADDGSGHGILAPNSVHIRLVNRTCYYDDAVDQLRSFLARYDFEICRIARIDLCLDFEYFDYGDQPDKFLQRYLKGRYSKINQADIALHGRDMWDGRYFNSVSWGSKKSAIRTRFYDKTMELKEGKDKPYIRQAWQAAGLVDNWQTLTKKLPSGQEYTPRIWRVEFAITSGRRNWLTLEHDNRGRSKMQSIRHTLAMYDDKDKLLSMFLSLADHYFHFKRVEYKERKKSLVTPALSAITMDCENRLVNAVPERELQRKDRCADKLLFRIADANQFYKLENIASDTPSSKPLDSLLKRIEQYREKSYKPEVVRACNTIIDDLLAQKVVSDTTQEWPSSELTILRLLLSEKIKHKAGQVDKEVIRELIRRNELFGEN